MTKIAWEPGTRVYAVDWRSGIPFIVTGRVVQRGTKKISRWVKWDRKPNAVQDARVSIREAIEADILTSAKFCVEGMPHYGRFVTRPWHLVYVVTQLRRLAKKLKARNLIRGKLED